MFPKHLFDFLKSKCPPADEARVVDVGSGTGLLTCDLLRLGYRTIAIEPSYEMRAVAERDFASNPRFRSLEGWAESLPLDAKTVDLIAVAQALEWFDVQRASAEFLRVLKPSGKIAIIRNDRVRGDPLRGAVDQLLSGFGETKHAALKAQDDRSSVYRFFGTSCPRPRPFPNEQRLNEDEFIGLVFSGSFVPLRTSNEGKRQSLSARRKDCGALSNGCLFRPSVANSEPMFNAKNPALSPVNRNGIARQRSRSRTGKRAAQ